MFRGSYLNDHRNILPNEEQPMLPKRNQSVNTVTCILLFNVHKSSKKKLKI